MSDRDRAEGWRHAKLSGHLNEDEMESLLKRNRAFQENFLSRIGRTGDEVTFVSGGGLGEERVPSVFGNGSLTTPKVDMYIKLRSGATVTFSVKKSLGGQVYLVTTDNFIEAYEKHFENIPEPVKRGIRLYWGSAEDTLRIVDEYGTNRPYERIKHRVVADTLKRFDPQIADELIGWFRTHAGKLSELCFARGGASDPADWAQYVWYKNELGEMGVDSIIRVSDINEAVDRFSPSSTYFGSRNGGSTIQLPFGFVQWHSPTRTIPGNLQFHHSYHLIINIVSSEKIA